MVEMPPSEKRRIEFAENAGKTPQLKEQALSRVERKLWSMFSRMESYVNPDDLVGKKGLDIYTTMQQDDQIKAGVKVKNLAIMSPGWSIQPGVDDDAAALADAEHIVYVFEQMTGTVARFVMDGLTALKNGFVIIEPIYKRFTMGKYAGKWGLKRLKLRPAKSFDFTTDDYGNITKLTQTKAGLRDTQELNYADFLHWIYGGDSSNPYGESDLRAAYRSYYSKDILVKFWNIFQEKFAAPTAVGKYEPGTKDPEIDEFLEIIKSVAYRQGVALPNTWEIEFLEASRAGESGFKDAVAYHDRAIARSLLIPSLMLETGEYGSRSTAGEQIDFFFTHIETVANDFAEMLINEQLIKRHINYNFGEREFYPKFVWNERRPADKEKQREAIRMGLDGQVLDPSEPFIREAFGWPDRPDEFNPKQNAAPAFAMTNYKPDTPKGSNGNGATSFSSHAGLYFAESTTPGLAKFDRAGAELDLDVAEKNLFIEVGALLTKERKEFENLVTGWLNKKNPNIQKVSQLDIKRRTKLRDAFSRAMSWSWANGIKHAHTEVEKGIGEKLKFSRKAVFQDDAGGELEKLPPPTRDAVASVTASIPFDDAATAQFLNTINQRAFVVAGVMSDRIAAEARNKIMLAINEGWGIPETMLELNKVFSPYIEVGVGADVISPHRLETIARTNISSTMNDARYQYTQSPELDRFMAGYEYTAILDSRVTDICESLGNPPVFFTRDDPDLYNYKPPNHFNCRSQLIAITKYEPFAATPKDDRPTVSDIPDGFQGPKTGKPSLPFTRGA